MYSLTKAYKIRFVSTNYTTTFSFIVPSSHIMKNIPEWNEISKQLFFSQIQLEGGGVVG